MSKEEFLEYFIIQYQKYMEVRKTSNFANPNIFEGFMEWLISGWRAS